MQDDWNPDWQSTSSSKVTYLVRQLKQLQESNTLIGYPTEKREVMPSDISFSSKMSYYNTSPNQEASQNSRNGWCRNGLEKVIVFSQFLEHIHIIEQQVNFDETCTYFFLLVSSVNETSLKKFQLSVAGIQFAGMYSPMHSGNKVCSHLLYIL